MTKTAAILLASAIAAIGQTAPAVIDASSVSLSLDAGGTAVVRYRLTGAPAIITFDIERRDQNGNWSSTGVPFENLIGDASRLIQPDASSFKEIRWDASRDWPDQSLTNGLFRARITAWDKAAPPDYMVIDLNTFEETFYETADRLPLGGLANDHYRTNALVMRRIHAAGETFVMGQATSNSEAASCVESFSPADASQHWVSLTNDFYMAVFETTQAQHRKLGAASSRSKDTSDSRKPVDGISYLRLRMASTGTASDIDWPTTESAVGGDLAAIRARTGIEFDIPTEAEWEFACRAGTATAYYNGGEFTTPTTGTPSLTDIAWYTKNRDEASITDDGGKLGGLQVVGHKEPNAWGLYDMCGNASEWCKDYAAAYDASEQPAIAPTGPVSGTARIKRGGNWYSPGAHAASSSRRSTTHTDYSVDDSSGTGVWANGYRLICPAVGDNSFRISRDTGTGKLLSVVMDGEQVFVIDPAIEAPVEFDADGAEGTWRSHIDWNVHPSESMVQGSLSFEWCGTEPVRLHSITIHHGKMPGGAGGYLLPGMFPPVARQFADFRNDRVEEGSKYTPMAIGETGGRSVMLVHDELRSYSDYSTPLVTERADGFTLSTRYDSAGWIRPGETQTVGDFWLVFRDGNAEEHLRNTGDWFRKVGMLPPADRPDWVRDIVLYSLHPCGRNDDMRCDPDGLALSRSYLPFLETLGVNCVWMRPIEKESPYMPDDYFSLQSGVGTVEDLTNYVTEAHSRGIRVWRDAVPHGGRATSQRAKEHPEFLAWMESGQPDTWWTYDYFAPGWIAMFSNIVWRLTAEANLDGWRIDVANGSRFPNWNPDIPYARGSFAMLQGALAQNRAIRAASRAVTSDAATLGETTYFSGAAVCDSIYDYRPNLLWFWRFIDTSVATCVTNIRRHLHERQAALPPGTIQMRYVENHDSHPAQPVFGRAGATALFAMTAFCDGYPLIYQETEDGCFETMREILRVRSEMPELVRGDADYLCVSAPDGVFAILRTLGGNAAVALVNFNGKQTQGEVSWPGGTFECDLPPFGWEVRRVAGEGTGTSRLPQSRRHSLAVSSAAPDATASGQRQEISVTLCDGTPATCRIVSETLASGAVRYRVADLGGMDATNVQIVVRLPNAMRWFAQTAEGDFDGTSFVRHPQLGWVGSTKKFGLHDTAVRWSSTLHPFGFTPERACVGLEDADDSVIAVTGIDSSCAEVVVLDRLDGVQGLAIAIRASDLAGLACEVDNCDFSFVNNSASSLTGLPELTAVMAGWEWESGNLRLAIRRNGTLRGAWHRDIATGEWRKCASISYARTDVEGTATFTQSDAFGDPIRFWSDPDGAVHLDFGPGDLRTFDGRMSVPVWFRTRYTLRPGEDDFLLESAISIERDYATGEGEIAFRLDLPQGAGSAPSMELTETGTPVSVSDEARSGGGIRRFYRWLSPSTSLSAPKGAWHGVRLHFGAEESTQAKDNTHE